MMDQKKRVGDWGIMLLFFVIPVVLNWKALAGNELMFNGDGMISFSQKIFQYQSIASGEIPLWNGYVTAGSPFLADPTSAFFYPFHALALFFAPTLYTNLYYILHMGLGSLFAYSFLKLIGNNKLAAFAGAIIFSLSPIIGGFRREHVAVYTCIIWMPLILYFIENFIQSGRKRFLFFSSFAMTLQLVGGHPQWVLYTDILAFCYILFRSLYLKRPVMEILKSILLWGSAYLLLSSAYIIPLAESLAQSARGNADYFCLYSTSGRLFLMTFFPNVFGNTRFPLGDYSSAEISIEVYLGTITLIYALYAIRYHFSNWFIKFSIAAMPLSLVYSSSCNIPFLSDFIKRIPVLNLFGVQSRILFIFIFFGIVCFTFGISDLSDDRNLKRLARHSFFMMFFMIILSVLIYNLGWSIKSEAGNSLVEDLASSPFGIPIALSIINFLIVGILYLARNHVPYKRSGIFTIIFLLFLACLDLWRFSSIHSTADFDNLTKTEETITLKKLLNGSDPYRVMAIYKDIYGGDYYKSGLVDNWSLINGIRNIKGFSEIENPSLNELLGQVASRDNTNGYNLLSDGSLLSMLSVKYILIPQDSPAPKVMTRLLPESEIIAISSPITVPGNGVLFVSSIPVHLVDQGYYQIKLGIEALRTDIKLFYVDFYGGSAYDQPEQDKHIEVMKGNNEYNGIIYAGEKIPNQGNVDFRIVGITDTPLVINNLKIIKLVPPPDNPDYVLVSQTSRYRIYDNKRARELLYIPRKVKTIENAQKLRNNPSKHPFMDRISYVEGYKNLSPTGNLEILSVKNNSLTAHVSSQAPTFVVHSQRYYPGWKAYVDNTAAHIHLVNGVVQGIEVPPGEHVVKFEYDPWSVKLGLAISIITLLSTAIYISMENRKQAGKPL